MRLYAGSSWQFIEDTVQNQIAEKLRLAFAEQYRFNPSRAEVSSWRNSLRAMCSIFQRANLTDHGVLLEYQLPFSSKRLDCMVCGRDAKQRDSAVIVELKQWDSCRIAEGDNEVLTWVGGGNREVLHPAAQARQYKRYLEDVHTAFYEEPSIALNACSYLHNYAAEQDDPLYADKYREAIDECPLFASDDTEALCEFLAVPLSNGNGLDVLRRVEAGKYRPSKKLMEHVAGVIRGDSAYTLLDEQLVVYDKVFAIVRKGFHGRKTTVLIVKGGPGTGKSVVALNLMADLLKEGYNAHYATGSKSFTETLRKVIGRRAAPQFKFFNSYVDAEPNAVDVLICDESHRLREKSLSMYMRKADRPKTLQVEELLRAAKVCVFLIDDKQSVRPNEIGSTGFIREHAEEADCAIHEHELEVQFRCKGSEAFVSWLDNTLGLDRTAHVLWTGNEDFDFRIMESPEALDSAIKNKVREGYAGRLVAGFCWPWSPRPRSDGTLEEDVTIGDFRRPWNARHNATGLAKGIPKAQFWAYEPGGMGQVGCIYTAQGFEFDYVGVIVGPDLTYDLDKQKWLGRPRESKDLGLRGSGEAFVDLVRKAYRVLFSRGMAGCYVYFMDKDAERFFRSRVEYQALSELTGEAKLVFCDVEDEIASREAYRTLLPVYPLAAAAGGLSEEQAVVRVERWVRVPDGTRPTREMFVAQVRGRSMVPLIHDGDYCIFRLHPAGTRQGKIVLVRLMETADQETGGRFTIKRYRSSKAIDPDSGWRHIEIKLLPENPEFKPIVLTAEKEGDVQVVAEFVTVLGRAD